MAAILSLLLGSSVLAPPAHASGSVSVVTTVTVGAGPKGVATSGGVLNDPDGTGGFVCVRQPFSTNSGTWSAH